MRVPRLFGPGLLTLAATLALAAPAVAGTLATAPFNAGYGGPVTGINCEIVNLGRKNVQVTIEVRELGEPASTAAFDLPPGASFNHSAFGTANYYCHFAFNGSAKKVRAAGQAVDNDYSPYAIEPAR